MAFAKFNLCNPCCSNTAICHPSTVVNITNPSNKSTPTPTAVDLWAAISSAGGVGVCTVGTAMYPSGGSLSPLYPTPSAIIPCEIPADTVFYYNNEIGVFISNYQNGTLIDLNTEMRVTSNLSKQKFNVPRYTGYNPTQCDLTEFTYTCPCYEVDDNQSSAWGVVNYQIYPSDYYLGCATGQYQNNVNPYIKCSSSYAICSADICNGTGIGKHQEVNLPYCLNQIHADIYDVQSTLQGIPGDLSIYNASTGHPCSGVAGIDFNTSIRPLNAACHSSTGLTYKYWHKPTISVSGCNSYSVPGYSETHMVMTWREVVKTVDKPANYCLNQTRRVLFDCQDLLIDTCGITHFSPTVISDKTGYFVNIHSCAIPNNCPSCLEQKSSLVKVPMSCDVSISYPFSDNQIQYQGSLTLDNITASNSWVPNPFTVPCGSSILSFPNYSLDSRAVTISYQGYQLTRCCVIGVGCTYSSTCYQNELNYALVSATCVDMGLSCTTPVLSFGGLSKYYPSDNNNNCLECCDVTDGSPTGSLDCSGGGSCAVGINNCSRPASPLANTFTSNSSLWKTKSCCERFGAFLNLGGVSANWPAYCNANGFPECVYDGAPLTVLTPTSGNLVNDLCNDILSYSLYDANGNLIYTVSV